MLAHLLHRAGHRVGRARGPQPRLRRAARPRRACSSRARSTCCARPASASGCDREGLVHHGHRAALRRRAASHRLCRADRRRAITVYGQQEVVKDLIARAAGRRRRRCASRSTTSRVHDLDTRRPRVRFRHDGAEHELRCDFIAGCDGFHGVCRARDPATACSRSTSATTRSPGSGILAEVAPVDRRADLRPPRARLRAAQHALAERHAGCTCSARPTTTSTTGPTSASGRSCRRASATDDGWRAAARARSLEKGITPMRSFVVEPMQLRAAVPGRRRRAHRAADRRQGPEPGRRRRARARRGARRVVRRRRPRALDAYSDTLPAPRLAGPALLLVDDVDAAPLPRRRPVRARGCSARSCATCRASRAAATTLAENYVGPRACLSGGLFGDVLARGRVRAATGDAAWLQAMLDVEAALARAQAAAGLIAAEHADAIAAACRAERYDLDALGAAAAAVGNPAAPLVRALRAAVGDPAARRRAPRRDQPGRHRQRGDARRPARARSAARRPRAARPTAAARAGERPPRDGHGRAHAAAAGGARRPSA